MYRSVPVTQVGTSPKVTESVEVDAVSVEIRRWSSLSEDECQIFVTVEDGVLNEFEMMCQLLILFPFHFVVLRSTHFHNRTSILPS
jgi:hypothetical protein